MKLQTKKFRNKGTIYTDGISTCLYDSKSKFIYVYPFTVNFSLCKENFPILIQNEFTFYQSYCVPHKIIKVRKVPSDQRVNKEFKNIYMEQNR